MGATLIDAPYDPVISSEQHATTNETRPMDNAQYTYNMDYLDNQGCVTAEYTEVWKCYAGLCMKC